MEIDVADLTERLAQDFPPPEEVDKPRVERALAEHFLALGEAPLPVRWTRDAEEAYLLMQDSLLHHPAMYWHAFGAGVESLMRRFFSRMWPAPDRAAEDAAYRARPMGGTGGLAGVAGWRAAHALAIVRSLLPIAEAYAAGLWMLWVRRKEVIAVPRPTLKTVGGQLHCEDGPAVSWPGGARYFFLSGLQVEERIVMRPESITLSEIASEEDRRRHRGLIDRFGRERYLRESNATCAHEDRYGKLWRIEGAPEHSSAMVEVEDATPRPEWSRPRHFIWVPPAMTTSKAAVAWTFWMDEDDYNPYSEC